MHATPPTVWRLRSPSRIVRVDTPPARLLPPRSPEGCSLEASTAISRRTRPEQPASSRQTGETAIPGRGPDALTSVHPTTRAAIQPEPRRQKRSMEPGRDPLPEGNTRMAPDGDKDWSRSAPDYVRE